MQGATYEGIFKTFSHDFDVVLELAHKIDSEDSQKLNVNEVVDNLIFQSKDIVNMCAQNIEPEYAFNTASKKLICSESTALTRVSRNKVNAKSFYVS